MVSTTTAIILLYLENLVVIIQSTQIFHKQVGVVIHNNIQATMQMLRLSVKSSMYVTTIKLMISFVQMEQSSIKNILCVFGGTSSIVTQHPVYII